MVDHGWRATLGFEPTYPSPAVRAAVLVLLAADGGPMHYRDIAAAAVESGAWVPKGNTPWHTLNRDVRRDIRRSEALGVPSVFARAPGGQITLHPRQEPEAAMAPVSDRDALRRELLNALLDVDPQEVEHLVGELLRRVGFDDVEVTRYSGDGGIDVRGTFDCGSVSQQRFVFQVKRTRSPVGQRVIRELRGTLDDDEQGVLVTTSSVLPAARRLAAGWRRPLVLIEGDQLADLLIDNELGVRRIPADRVTVIGFDKRAAKRREAA